MKKTLLLLLFVFSLLIIKAEIIEKVYYFNDYKITNHGNYQTISFPNTLVTGLEGEPALPYCSVSLILPPGQSAESIEFIGQEETTINGTFLMYPQQAVRPISEGSSGKFLKNEAVYSLNAKYPSTSTGHLSTQFMNGFSFGLSAFTPVKYNPSNGTVTFYKKVIIRIYTKSEGKSASALNNITSSKEILTSVSKLAQNPEAMYAYPSRKSRNDDYQLLIITPTAFQSAFQPLIDMYKIRGIKALTVTKEYISSNISGQDVPEKMRNYIIQEYQNHGIEHVLLAGDVDQIPYRGFYCYVTSAGGNQEDSNIPSDLYFSSLDGNWNTDGDNKWGEIGEDDLIPELSVARMTASNLTELNHMINKTVSYQSTPVLGEMAHPLFAGEHLYDNPNTEGSQYLELLIGHHEDNGYTTDGVTPDNNIEKMYDEVSPWSSTDLINHLNQGRSFLHHSGHANETYVMKLSNSDITDANFSQLNGVIHNYALVYTHGCLCGAFDYDDCIAEKMVNISNFAAAFVGNSRFGWFNEGQTEGPSIHLEREFVDAMYTDGLLRIGRAHSESRAMTAPWVNAPGQWEQGALRWCFYDCNVLGDPAMAMWTKEPMTVQAAYQAALPLGVPTFPVTVTNNGSPVSHVNCVLIKNNVIHGVAATDETGNAVITIDPAFTDVGDAQLIISGNNCLPQTFPVSVIPNGGSYITCDTHAINDTLGNSNGQIDNNEAILLSLGMKNVGSVQADNVIVTLSTTDSYTSVVDSTENYGNIAPNTTITKPYGFRFNVAANVPDNHLIPFNITATDGTNSWSSSINLIAHAPVLQVGNMTITDPEGNNNGRLDPGETANITIQTTNSGSAEALSTLANLTSSNGNITINTPSVNLGTIAAGASASATFSITVSASAPIGNVVDLNYSVTSGQYQAQKSFFAKVGLVVEDFESGNFTHFAWTQGGNQPWTITNSAPYEGTYSAKSGAISNSQSSTLSLQMNVSNADTLSFYYKTSSESGWDYLKFYIDNTSVGQWSGEVAWTKAAFPVTAGNHTFKWEYMKDGSQASGSDCAWLDYILFPASAPIGQTVSGMVTYANTTNTALNGITINLKNSSGTTIATTTTNASGNYSFTTVPAGNYTFGITTTKPWGGVSATDVLLYRKHIANITPLTGIYLASGDVNASGSLSAADVLLIRKRIAAVINSFQVGDWMFNNAPFTVGSSNVTQNFNGIVYGDANGSYVPATKSLEINHQGILSIASVDVSKNDVIVPINLNGVQDMGSFQFTVQYDPSNLTFTGVDNWYNGIQDVTVGNNTPGFITFVWAADVNGISMNEATLCNIHFASTSSASSALTFVNNPTQIEFSDYNGNLFVPDFVNGTVGSTTGIGELASSSLSVFPNPGNGLFTIALDKNVQNTVNIKITNAFGKIVYQENSIPAGKISGTTIDLSKQPNGIYILSLEDNKSILQKKLVIKK